MNKLFKNIFVNQKIFSSLRGFYRSNLLLLIMLFFAIYNIFIIVSCDKVDPPYTTNTENIDTAKCPVPQFPALTIVYKKILVEDFTGHKCGNCPRAHTALRNLINSYGDTIVGVALHVGYYATPESDGLYTYDFRTPEGTQIDQTFHISDGGLPNGMINRTKDNNNVIINDQSWPIVVQSMLADQPKLAMQIINNYDASDSSFCTHIKLTFLENITDTLMFFCGLTEDSIIKPQINYDIPFPNDVPAYNHMHVFRGSLNGAFGITISNNITIKDSTIIKSYFYNLKQKDFVHKNLKVFAYVYKFNGDVVLQAEEKKVE